MCTNNFSEPSTPPVDPATQSEYSSSATGSPSQLELSHLSINIRMGDHTYMKTRTMQIHDGLLTETSLPESTHSHTAPSTSAYDIQTYTTIAPYNSYSIPSYDTALPTPVSVAGSPSISEGTTKHMQSYGQQRGRSSQQPTPPGTSRPDWVNQHMNMQTSQSGSPLPLQHTANDMLEMHGIEASHSPPEDQGQPLVSETHWDWGHYGVSCTEPPADMSPQLAHQPLFPVNVPPNVAPSALVRSSMTMNHSNIPLAPAGAQVPVLQQSPDPRNLAPSVTPMGGMGHHYHPLQNQPPVIMEFAPLRKRPHKTRSRHARRGPRVTNRDSMNGNGYRDYDGNQQFGADKPQRPQGEQITLSDDAPEPDRFLFDLRNEMLDSKGKGMWEALQARFTERYGAKERAALQMQLSRAVMKHGQWPVSEDEALRKAVAEVNRRRYSDIAKQMKEFGGCRAWDFSDLHISKRMVELGLEEYDPEEPSKRVRRARKPTARRTTSVSGPWNPTTGTASHYGGYHHPHHHLHHQPPQQMRTLTEEQEEHLIKQFCKPEPDSPEPDADVNMMAADDHNNGNSNGTKRESDTATPERDTGHADSARVAKRACEQMFSKSVYGGLVNESRHPMP